MTLNDLHDMTPAEMAHERQLMADLALWQFNQDLEREWYKRATPRLTRYPTL